MEYGHTNRGVSGALYLQSAQAGVNAGMRAVFVSLRLREAVEKWVLLNSHL